MSIINKTIIFFISIFIFSATYVSAEELKKIGKFKDWEVMSILNETENHDLRMILLKFLKKLLSMKKQQFQYITNYLI